MHRRLVGALGTAIAAVVLGAGPVAGTADVTGAPDVIDAASTAAPSDRPEAAGASDGSSPERPAGGTDSDGRAVAAPGDWWPLSIVAGVVLLLAGVVVVGRIRRPV